MRRALRVILVVAMALAAAAAELLSEAREPIHPAVVLGRTRLFYSAEYSRVVGLGDLNGDGLLDVVLAQPQNLLALWGQGNGRFASGGWQSPFMSLREPVPGGYLSRAVGTFLPILGAVTDLDGDGDADVAVAVVNKDSRLHQVFLFENVGDGYLRSVRAFDLPVEIGVGPDLHVRLFGFWVQDFNRDGKVDLAFGVRGPREREIWFMEGVDPLEWAAPVLMLVVPLDLKPMALTDLDCDGVPELVLRKRDEVHVLIGDDPDRYLRFRGELKVVPRLGEVLDIGVADVDGDRDNDLVILTQLGLEVWLLDSDVLRPGPLIKTTIWGDKLYLGDFDGDGFPDAVVESGPQRWNLLCGDRSGGFYWGGSEHFLAERNLMVVDLDRDRASDLLTSAGYTLTAYFSQPRGESTIPLDAVALIGAGDLSENGGPDILVWDRDGLLVLWNDGRGGVIRRELYRSIHTPLAAKIVEGHVYVLQVVPRFNWVMHSVEKVGQVLVLDKVGRMVAQIEVGVDPAPALGVIDFDADGEQDVLILLRHEVVILWSGREIERYRWTRGELSLAWCHDSGGIGGAGCFVLSTAEYSEIYALSFARRQLEVAGPSFQLAGVPVALAGGDVDRDGLADPVALCWLPIVEEAGLRSAVVLGVGHSSLGLIEWEVLREEAPHPLTGLAVGDFNGDGWRDIAFTVASAAGVYVLLNRGGGQFAEPVWKPVWAGPLLAEDLDRNGVDELIASTTGLAPYLWILWNGGAP